MPVRMGNRLVNQLERGVHTHIYDLGKVWAEKVVGWGRIRVGFTKWRKGAEAGAGLWFDALFEGEGLEGRRTDGPKGTRTPAHVRARAPQYRSTEDRKRT